MVEYDTFQVVVLYPFTLPKNPLTRYTLAFRHVATLYSDAGWACPHQWTSLTTNMLADPLQVCLSLYIYSYFASVLGDILIVISFNNPECDYGALWTLEVVRENWNYVTYETQCSGTISLPFLKPPRIIFRVSEESCLWSFWFLQSDLHILTCWWISKQTT